MRINITSLSKKLGLSFVTLALALSTLGQVAFAKVDESLSYFNGAIEAKVQGPDVVSISKGSAFNVTITDAHGAAYPLAAKWVNATVEMTDMDMGVTKAKVSDVLDASGKVQGVLKVEPTFSMKGPWKLNLKLTTASGNESHSVSFDVVK
ncbi:MAG: hypothetical protein ACXVLQ_12810 [Bacteriovorax sp.]